MHNFQRESKNNKSNKMKWGLGVATFGLAVNMQHFLSLHFKTTINHIIFMSRNLKKHNF